MVRKTPLTVIKLILYQDQTDSIVSSLVLGALVAKFIYQPRKTWLDLKNNLKRSKLKEIFESIWNSTRSLLPRLLLFWGIFLSSYVVTWATCQLVTFIISLIFRLMIATASFAFLISDPSLIPVIRNYWLLF